MAEEEIPPVSLGRLTARYTALRFGVFAAVYVVAGAILVPILPDRVALLDAGLAAVVVSFPISARVGRSLRAQITDAIVARRDAAKQKDSDDEQRIEAVRRARAAKSGTPADR